MVVIFLLQTTVEGFTDSFVLVSSEVTERPWTLITSMFLHGSLTHLLSNLFALLLFGTILESIIGRSRFLLLYFSAGIIASIATLFFYEASLGASGAIFGVLGALAALRPRMTVWVMGIPMPMLAAAGVWLLIDLLGMFAPSGIANAAHIAGLLFGAAISIIFLSPNFPEEKEQEQHYPVSESRLEKWEKKYMRS
ncbi:MAG: rhomboid family intramembrane serine protease [Candidatus Aenigmarchaeota archaeon]|nr:rhomboid family intramembrane serine protease [Candidatus Aenigmarchaeota archaeon]